MVKTTLKPYLTNPKRYVQPQMVEAKIRTWVTVSCPNEPKNRVITAAIITEPIEGNDVRANRIEISDDKGIDVLRDLIRQWDQRKADFAERDK
jgi:hypothetical protein